MTLVTKVKTARVVTDYCRLNRYCCGAAVACRSPLQLRDNFSCPSNIVSLARSFHNTLNRLAMN